MKGRRSVPALLFAAWLTGPAFVPALAQGNASTGQLAETQAQLEDLKARIAALQQTLTQGEASKAGAADQLRETELAISEKGRRLRNLAKARGAAQGQLIDLQKQAQELQGRINTQQEQLSTLLRRQYIAGEANTLSRFLGGQDPNQPARDAYYVQGISRAEATWIAELHRSLKEKAALTEAVQTKTSELAAIEAQSKSEQAELLTQKEKHQAVVNRIARELKAQRREMHGMQKDENRLARLVEGLARIVREREAKARQAAKGSSRDERPAPQPFIAPTGVRFSDLKGRLAMPTKGKITHTYGSHRADSSSTWKGLFITTGKNGAVDAVAAGRVVFADWLRGFGNLIILDHGDDYLTVYGNNETLYKAVGDPVAAGEAIAATGSSGGNAETGLYFELRFQGQPLDPMKWMRR